MITLVAALALGAQSTFSDLPYATGGSKSQTLDLYLPENRAKKSPVIVYIHGGAFAFGSSKSSFMPKWVLQKGYALASLNYRLSGEETFPAAVQDCKAAVRWLRAHAAKYNLDPNRFVAWGESAGGNLAAMVGAARQDKGFDLGEYDAFSSGVQGVVDYYGPTDFSKMDAQALPGSPKHNPADSPESKYVGGPITELAGIVAQANPISFVNPKTPPFFIAHGTEDHVVPFGQSELLVAALKKAGVAVTFMPVVGTDHGFKGISAEQQKALDDATAKFLEGVFGAAS